MSSYVAPGRRVQVGIASAGEPVNGEVVTYRLSPEEIAARYGPPTGRKGLRHQLTAETLVELLRTKTVGQVAEQYHVPQRLVYEMCDAHGLELDDKNRLAGGDKVARWGEAKKLLPRDELEKMLRQGLKAHEIAAEKGIGVSTVESLKKKYNLAGVTKKGRPKTKGDNNMTAFETYKEGDCCPLPEAKATNNSPQVVVKKMTVAQAVAEWQKMTREAECINEVIRTLDGKELTSGVQSLLQGYHDGCARAINRLTTVFESTTIEV